MSDRELLTQLFALLSKRTCITMDDVSLTDMVKRYQNPPLTALNRVALQLTVPEYNELSRLMHIIGAHLNPPPLSDLTDAAARYDEG